MDPVFSKNPSINPYHYVQNNPINRFDPDGKWDLKLIVGKNGKAILTVQDRHGNIVKTYDAKARGSHRNRMKTNGDTPYGTYKIQGWKEADKNQSPEHRHSYGPQSRLMIKGTSGEAKESKRDLLRIHGGDLSGSGELRSTLGCVRLTNENKIDLKETTDKLESDDPEEKPNELEVKPEEPYLDTFPIEFKDESYVLPGSIA